ncbi:MAG TPA: ferredoxin-NADP reductase [Bacteroidetes bacterium]|nr:MAG: ferredoxin-NADP reductase [Sphingobacteriales bacterium BACL12 MAG-120802-bin5]KRP13748.1 MAG: ferredoxin-NADP reductase [Sphingobacteriales bacterium BACL12 MAG-120813-bin55]HCK22599.1 ferredoxin-NADP reductase [Bacteroidota bacterium]
MTHVTAYNTNQQYQAKVLSSKRLTPVETEEIREIHLEVDDPSFHCQVNNSFGVLVKTTGAFGNDYHHRLYSIADLPERKDGATSITMLVKRCYYVDEFSGEQYPGIASNYLCDRHAGDTITITGPFPLPFQVPENHHANLLLISMGTGIAPFRAFVKHIYEDIKDWNGQVRLFYGARSGLELLYLNDKDGDLTNYYDRATFEAFHAVSPRPEWADPIALDAALEDKAAELQALLDKTNTYVYVAGYEKISSKLDKAFANILGSEDAWKTRKAELKAGKKWAEMLY